MRKTIKKILCTLLVVVMCLTSAPLEGYVGLDFKYNDIVSATSNEEFTDYNNNVDDGVFNYKFIEPVKHLTKVPDDFIGIYTDEDLYNIRYGLDGNYILMNNISLKKYLNWEPINNFSGVFDGNGYEISDLSIKGSYKDDGAEYYGLFGFSSGQFRNLGVSNANINVSTEIVLDSLRYGSCYIGTIVAYLSVTYDDKTVGFENCFTNSNIVGSDGVSYIGGCLGYVNAETAIDNCYSNGQISTSKGTCGGIVGRTDIHVYNCLNFAQIEGHLVGGVVGTTVEEPAIRYCNNFGTIVGNLWSGGIAADNRGTITNCKNYGSILASGLHLVTSGGIVGYNREGRISKCINYGNISALSFRNTDTSNAAFAGGIIGSQSSIRGINLRQCVNYGEIYAEADVNSPDQRGAYVTGSIVSVCAGGIIGEFDVDNANSGIVIAECCNLGKSVSSRLSVSNTPVDGRTHNYCGGIIGYASTGCIQLQDCFNLSDCKSTSSVIPVDDMEIKAYNYCGGIIGYANTFDSSSFYNTSFSYGKTSALGGYENHTGSLFGSMKNRYLWERHSNYYLIDCGMPCNGESLSGCLALYRNEFSKQDYLCGFDFENIWTYDSSNYYSYPVLKNIFLLDSDAFKIAKKDSLVFENGDDYTTYIGDSILFSGAENSFRYIGLEAKLYSNTLTEKDVIWTSSDESILRIISSGGSYNYERQYTDLWVNVKAIKGGKVTLTATTSDGDEESCTVTVKGSDYYLEVTSTNSSNSVPVGETIPLIVSFFKNDKRSTTKRSYNLVFDNPDIFEVETAEPFGNSSGAYFDLKLKAKNVGETNLTISDPETGAYITLLLIATERMNVYYFNNIPSKEYQKGRLTNFYNYNGLCVDGFYYTQQNGSYYVDMNVWNSKHHFGVAVSYNKNGQIHDFEILDPFKEYETTFIGNVEDLVYNVEDLFKLFGDEYYYTGSSISELTHVHLEVPKDGYVIVGNNCSEIELAYIVNMIEYTVNVALSTASASIGMSEKSALIKDLSKNIVKDLIESGLIQVVQTYASSLSKNISYKNINVNVAGFTEAMKKLDLDIVKIVTEAINLEFGISLAESVLWNILPTGKVIEMMFAFNDALNIVAQADDFAKSCDAPLIVLYPPLSDDESYTSNGVIVNPEKELSPDYVLHSYIVSQNNQLAIEADKVLNEVSEEYKIYNITLYKNGKETQTYGKIKVMIPIPAGYDKNNIQVYWYKEDGTIESVNAKVEGNYAVFETDHLSYYVIAELHSHSYEISNVVEATCENGGSITYTCDCGDTNTETIPATGHTFDGSKCTSCGYDKADECDCNCHASGIKKFFFNFILFFQKLFKKNAVCACGVAHY